MPGEDQDAIGLDLVAPEMFAPVLRTLTWAAVGLGTGAALLSALWLTWPGALAVGLAVAAPTVGYAVALRRRRMWLRGGVVHARTLFGTRTLDIAEATGVELLVYPGRLSRIVLRLTARGETRIVPLALYTDTGSGRELHVLGLRKLADALAGTDLAAGVAVADVLVAQLRAEARDAALGERPLYRGVRLVREKDAVQPVVLGDAEVAGLL
ncbi:hypothetical protein ACWEQ0_25360 [Nocardia thailandica]